ncbi:MAG: class I SAM-dependent methyltransferase [Actinomycetota bacterium]|nr:class I SAM-dependent methyltransferase [Actinomycetota bacterium]
MHPRLLRFLRCPECGDALRVEPLVAGRADAGSEISEGLLGCGADHWFPIVRGIPRMLPDALEEHRSELERHRRAPAAASLASSGQGGSERGSHGAYDRRTRESFSLEWEHHRLGDRTWGIDLEDRVRRFFLDPIRIPTEELDGKVLLDAGCGNGSQSVAYTEFGLEVIAIDLSSGLEHGQAFRRLHPGAQPDRVHFVQADLQSPPVAASSVDIIHSAGVLHHTPDTHASFRRLCPLLRANGTFYIWLYKYEPLVTPLVNAIRSITTRARRPVLARAARVLAGPFVAFCATLNALGIREYPRLSRREAALALLDIFAAPYAHYHSFAEVAGWYQQECFDEVWACNETRRGFGVCGRQGGGTKAGPAWVRLSTASGEGESVDHATPLVDELTEPHPG